MSVPNLREDAYAAVVSIKRSFNPVKCINVTKILLRLYILVWQSCSFVLHAFWLLQSLLTCAIACEAFVLFLVVMY